MLCKLPTGWEESKKERKEKIGLITQKFTDFPLPKIHFCALNMYIVFG